MTRARLPRLHRRTPRLCSWLRLVLLSFMALAQSGCSAPEDGRPRGQLPGGDGGNYSSRPVFSPSKLDGTRPLPPPAGNPTP
jgi:hypothetical protein